MKYRLLQLIGQVIMAYNIREILLSISTEYPVPLVYRVPAHSHIDAISIGLSIVNFIGSLTFVFTVSDKYLCKFRYNPPP